MKRSIWLIALLVMLSVLLLPAASAAEPDPAEMTNEELFAGYVEQLFYGDEDLNLFSVGDDSAGAKLTGNAKKYYDALVVAVKQIAAGERAKTEVVIGNTSEADIIVDGVVSPFETFEADTDLLTDALLADLPFELYWYDKTEKTNIVIWVCETQWMLQVQFVVANSYRMTALDPYTADISKTGAASASAENARAIVAEHASKSNYEKLLAYKEAICDLVDYNYDAADDDSTPYSDPWQMIYVFDGISETKVVCEGYSKAFQYLCDQSQFSGGVSCYSVSGTMLVDGQGGPHMWNIMTMEDGKNYLVDVTNSDEGSIGQEGELFLAGSPKLSTEWTVTYTDGKKDTIYTPFYLIEADRRNVGYQFEPDDVVLWDIGSFDGLSWEKAKILNLSENGYTVSICQHDWEWNRNVSAHWQKCKICGTETEKTDHLLRWSWDQTSHTLCCEICSEQMVKEAHKGNPCETCSYSSAGAAVTIKQFEQIEDTIKVHFCGSQLDGKTVVFAAASYDSKNKLIDIGFSQTMIDLTNYAPYHMKDAGEQVPTITGLKTQGAAKIVIFAMDQNGFCPLGKKYDP